jgi:hypothetical protein
VGYLSSCAGGSVVKPLRQVWRLWWPGDEEQRRRHWNSAVACFVQGEVKTEAMNGGGGE